MTAFADVLRTVGDLALRVVDGIVNIDDRTLRAIWVGTLYFGTFVVIGWGGRVLLDRWMAGKGMGMKDSDRLPGERPRRRFLLGAWRRED